MLSVSFACIKSRKNKAGQSPIQLWVNVDGQRATTLLDIKSEPNQFQKALKSKQPNPIQQYCNSIRAKITDYYAASACIGTIPTPKQIVEYVKNGFAVKQYMLYELFEDFLRIERSKIGHEIQDTTYYKYCLVVDRFKQAVLNKPINQVSHSDVLDFKYHLLNVAKLGTGTLSGYLTKAKTIFAYAIDNDLLRCNPFRQLKIQKEEVEIDPLTKEELSLIVKKDFRIKRLSQVRDCFVFACYTALAYSDLAGITRDDIREQSGVHYIQKHRVKTGVQYTIPLNDIAMEILERYDYSLPVLTNQRYNSYLKEIADICGIEKNLTSHLARHTAATLMLNSGISIDVVSKILGHSNTQMTAHYAKMLDKTIILTRIEF